MAAVAAAATLALLEPHMTGPGGDMFCLFYDAKTQTVRGVNGSGRSTKHLSYEELVEALEKERAGTQSSGGGDSKTRGVTGIPPSSVHSITVPGTVAGWLDTIEQFGNGKLTVSQILAPAIELAQNGVQVPEISASLWQAGLGLLKKQKAGTETNELFVIDKDRDGVASERGVFPGELYRNTALAETYKRIAEHGKKGFYSGKTAEMIVQSVQKRGGKLGLDDLESHESTILEAGEPISTAWPVRGDAGAGDTGTGGDGKKDENYTLRVHEIPPNGQGIVALQTLAILRVLQSSGTIPPLSSYTHNSPEYLHLLAEVLKCAFRDVGTRAIADLSVKENGHLNEMGGSNDSRSHKGVEYYLSDEYIKGELKKSQNGEPSNIRFSPLAASKNYSSAGPSPHPLPKISYGSQSDTVYLTATDQWGNACSLINSVYGLFGSGIVPDGLGFVLQNRGANFNLQKGTVNCYGPGKRPYHTIIPAMVTRESEKSSEAGGDKVAGGRGSTSQDKIPKGDLYATYGVMGGFMQPQGHVQVLLNMTVFHMNEQEALDAPRICLMPFEAKKELDNENGKKKGGKTTSNEGDDEGQFARVEMERGESESKAAELSKLGGSPGGPATTPDTVIAIEDGISQDVVGQLKQLGHEVTVLAGNKRALFGRGQVIRKNAYKVVGSASEIQYSAGSDMRGDGAAVPQLF